MQSHYTGDPSSIVIIVGSRSGTWMASDDQGDPVRMKFGGEQLAKAIAEHA